MKRGKESITTNEHEQKPEKPTFRDTCPRYVSICVLFLFSALSISAQTDLASLGQSLTGDTEAKRTALFAIRNLRSPEASRIAIPALTDKDEIVRATAAGSVVFLPKNEAAQALLPLLTDKSEMVRREAAYALGEVGDPAAARPLIQSLKDKIIEVRGAAAVALGRIGDVSAIDALVKILQTAPNDDNEFLRRSAARSIGQIAEVARRGNAQSAVFKTALPVLIKTLQNRQEADDTRREAAFALGAIGDSSAVPPLEDGSRSIDPYLAEICKEALIKIRTK